MESGAGIRLDSGKLNPPMITYVKEMSNEYKCSSHAIFFPNFKITDLIQKLCWT